MNAIVLDSVSFWDMMLWMFMAYIFFMFLILFFRAVIDVFQRDDLNGIKKVGWLLAIFILPLLGTLLYFLFRPVTTSDVTAALRASGVNGASAAAEISQGQALLRNGTITQAEFDALKSRALM